MKKLRSTALSKEIKIQDKKERCTMYAVVFYMVTSPLTINIHTPKKKRGILNQKKKLCSLHISSVVK